MAPCALCPAAGLRVQRPTPKKLILGLLLAGRGTPLSVRDAIRACALFDLTENNVRVTLVRLSAEGLICSAERGSYQLGPAAEGMADDIGSWREAPARLRPWKGRWLLLLGRNGKGGGNGGNGGGGRRAQRERARAYGLTGLRELEPGLLARPDNLAGGAQGLRQRLRGLGLAEPGLLCSAQDLDEAREQALHALWDRSELDATYRRETTRLQAWMERRATLELETAARESYLLGAEAIRRVVFDPWLPEPLVDPAARQSYFDAVLAFDAAGQQVWQQLYDRDAAMPVGGGERLGPPLLGR